MCVCNNNNNTVFLYCACPCINMFALGTLRNECAYGGDTIQCGGGGVELMGFFLCGGTTLYM